MANTLRIKRRDSSGGAGAPSSLANAELAFNEATQTLYYGTGTGGAGGTASSVISIGGVGAFLGLSLGVTQTAAGSYTFTGSTTFSGSASIGAATATTPSFGDDSTRVATTAWVQDEIAGLGGGGVTSVGLSMPAIFSVSGSPVTTSGTLTASLASQTKNTVFAAPTGSTGAPSFRALAASDIPDLSSAYLPISGGTITSGLVISGDLTVKGTTTTVESTTVTVADINIVLGNHPSPMDMMSDGGGITLRGSTDKTWNWVYATGAWTSSEHIALASGKAIYINGASVLSATTLGSGVTSSSLTSTGTVTSGVWSASISNVTIDGGTF